MDVHWEYADPADATGDDASRYVAGEQVRDVCAVVFHELVSESIQQLVHEMGRRLLERYPQLRSLDFVGQEHDARPVRDERGSGRGADRLRAAVPGLRHDHADDDPERLTRGARPES